MTWEELVQALGVQADAEGWLRVHRQHGAETREHVLQHVTIADWHLVLVQTSLAPDAQLGAAEAVVQLVRYPLGALVLSDGYWVLRQALSLQGLTIERLEHTLRCLDIQCRGLMRRRCQGARAGTHFTHYAE